MSLTMFFLAEITEDVRELYRRFLGLDSPAPAAIEAATEAKPPVGEEELLESQESSIVIVSPQNDGAVAQAVSDVLPPISSADCEPFYCFCQIDSSSLLFFFFELQWRTRSRTT